MRKVYPIKDGKKLNEIINGLSDYQTDHERRIYLLFMVGICTGLRIGDILRLTVGQVNHGDKIRLEEQKTGKTQEIKINQLLRSVLDNELDGMEDSAYLFPSRQRDRRGRAKHITVSTAENDLKKIAYWYKLNFPFSCHSLRKTYGYWHYQTNHNLALLARQFNHADIKTTNAYIGLDDDEMAKATEHMYDGIIPVQRKVPARKRSNQLNAKLYTTHHDRTAQKKAYAERLAEGRRKRQRNGTR